MNAKHPQMLQRVTAACVLFAFGLALVQPPPAAAQDSDADYDQLVADALAEYRAKHYLEARALFARAHELRPSARTLRGLGQAAFGAQLYSNAIVDLNTALGSDVNKLTPKMRREVEQTIGRAREYCGRFWVTLDPPDAELTVDGNHPVFDKDGALLLDVGLRRVRVSVPGKADRETSLQVTGGEEKNLAFSVAMEAKPPEDPVPTIAEGPPVQAPPPDIHLDLNKPQSQPPSEPKPFPWLAVGAFGLSGIGIGVGLWKWQERNSRIKSWKQQGCTTNPNDPICSWFQSKWQAATTWEIVSFSLAGAFAATGVVLLVLNGTDDDEQEFVPETTTNLACGPMGVGLTCQLRM